MLRTPPPAPDGAPRSRAKVAVVGAGAAGLTSAHVPSTQHDVTLLEADPAPSTRAAAGRGPGRRRRWRETFDERWAQVRPLGFHETFTRLWELSPAYCEAGFATHHLDVAQFPPGPQGGPMSTVERAITSSTPPETLEEP